MPFSQAPSTCAHLFQHDFKEKFPKETVHSTQSLSLKCISANILEVLSFLCFTGVRNSDTPTTRQSMLLHSKPFFPKKLLLSYLSSATLRLLTVTSSIIIPTWCATAEMVSQTEAHCSNTATHSPSTLIQLPLNLSLTIPSVQRCQSWYLWSIHFSVSSHFLQGRKDGCSSVFHPSLLPVKACQAGQSFNCVLCWARHTLQH